MIRSPKLTATVALLMLAALTGSLNIQGAAKTVANFKTGQPKPTEPPPASYGKLPLSFEKNLGQADPSVKFLSRTSGYDLFLTATEAVFSLRNSQSDRSKLPGQKFSQSSDVSRRSTLLRMKLQGVNPSAEIRAEAELPGKSHYFLGRDPKMWRRNIPNYAKLRYRQVYRGVDLLYYGSQGQLEYDFILAPGADPKAISLGFDGLITKRRRAQSPPLHVEPNGDLLLRTAAGEVRHMKPLIYQEVEGRRCAITGGYELKPGNRIGFRVGKYDPALPLVIDPVIVYSTYLGGSGTDRGLDIAVDTQGNAYVAGETNSIDFGGVGGGEPSVTLNNFFVAKFNAAGSSLLYSAVIGGSFDDKGWGIAVDALGNAYVAGETKSSDFPQLPPPPPCDGPCPPPSLTPFNGVVMKISPDGGDILRSTIIGGSGDDRFYDLALDPYGGVYLTGETSSRNFPVTPGALGHPTMPNDPVLIPVVKLNSAGALVFSAVIGGNTGSGQSRAYGIGVDEICDPATVGETTAPDFPRAGPNPAAICDPATIVAMRLNATGSAFIYSRVIGGDTGAGESRAFGVAVAPDGTAYLTGETSAHDFPVTPGAIGFGAVPSDPWNIPVVKLNPDGTIAYAALIGGHTGSGISRGHGIAIDQSCIPMIGGETSAMDFPTEGPNPAAGCDPAIIVAMRLNATGSAFIYSVVIGGNTETAVSRAFAVALDSAGNAYLTGETSAQDFPTASFDHTYNGGPTDAFVLKLSAAAFQICLLYDPTRAHRSGSTIPIKLQLCDGNGANLSSPYIVLNALSVTLVSSSSTGPPEDSGNANPDNNFRYDATLGGSGGYIYNLSTVGLASGTYELNFTVGNDPTIYKAPFQVR